MLNFPWKCPKIFCGFFTRAEAPEEMALYISHNYIERSVSGMESDSHGRLCIGFSICAQANALTPAFTG